VDNDKFEILDGQQRITSIGRFLTLKFAIKDENGNPQKFDGLSTDKRAKVEKAKLLIYECEGTETEIMNWFETINIAGIPLNEQEKYNAVYFEPFVTLSKAEFSNSQNSNIQKWKAYINGKVHRQDFLYAALDWVSSSKEISIRDYMTSHRRDTNINELKNYFNSVIDWVSSVFSDVEGEMCGLEWGRLYETYHSKAYNPAMVSTEVQKLYSDSYIKNRKGVFEYILGGSTDSKLLEVRVFDEATKKSVYGKQKTEAEKNGISNCPLCAVGNNANKNKIWSLTEMDADHVSAWSKGDATDIKNCELLCKTHNRAKGNK
jgi:hypothetical protein